MALDPIKNFAITTVATAPDPASTGTTLVVASGDGALFPDPSTAGDFNVVIFPYGEQPDSANAEIVRVTGVSTDTLTITREQEDTSARTVIVGDVVMMGITKKIFDDVEESFFAWEGEWATSTAYGVHDIVQYGGSAYICVTAHTSGTFTTDLSAGKWELFVTGIGGNSIQVDCSGGTSDTYGALTGLVNSSNTSYTVSLGSYVSGSLRVYLNGQLQTQGSSEDWTETTPASGTFAFATAPTTGDVIIAIYQFNSGTSGDADTVDGYHVASLLTPAGTVSMFAGSTAPTGYLLCDGSAVSRSTYSDLFTVIGTAYGVGDGSTTFNVPNMKGKVVVGYNSAETEFNTLGETGGAKTHTLSVAEMPVHTHTQDSHNHTQNSHNHTQNAHYHGIRYKGFSLTASTAWMLDRRRESADSYDGEDADAAGSTTATNIATTATNIATTATNQNAGSGSSHNNLQPYITLNFIIKT